VQPEGDEADDAEEREEVAEDADELRDPDGAEAGQTEDAGQWRGLCFGGNFIRILDGVPE